MDNEELQQQIVDLQNQINDLRSLTYKNKFSNTTLITDNVQVQNGGSQQSGNFVSGSTGWKIDGFGNAEFNSITLIGGNLSYGKTSFNDSTNAGYWMSSAGLYFGTTGDTYRLKYDLAGGTLDLKGTISSRLTSVIASAIDSTGHFIDSNIDTSTKTILSDFTFGVSGALQIGTYENGVSGDIRISPNGIIGRDSSGANTFTIDGTTGSATFTGSITGSVITGGTIQTSTTGRRIILTGTDDSLSTYDASGNMVCDINTTGQPYLRAFSFEVETSAILASADSSITFAGDLIVSRINKNTSTGSNLLLDNPGTGSHITFTGDTTGVTATDGGLYFNGTDLKLVVGATAHILTKSGANETITGTWNFSTNFPTLPATPTTARQAIPKDYVDAITGSLTYSAGDNLVISSDEELDDATSVAGAWTKKKEIKLNRSGTLRVKFDLKPTTGGSPQATSYGRIYRNGVAVGTVQQSNDNTQWVTKSEDISGWTAGDLLQLYVATSNVGVNDNCRNLRLYDLAEVLPQKYWMPIVDLGGGEWGEDLCTLGAVVSTTHTITTSFMPRAIMCFCGGGKTANYNFSNWSIGYWQGGRGTSINFGATDYGIVTSDDNFVHRYKDTDYFTNIIIQNVTTTSFDILYERSDTHESHGYIRYYLIR